MRKHNEFNYLSNKGQLRIQKIRWISLQDIIIASENEGVVTSLSPKVGGENQLLDTYNLFG